MKRIIVAAVLASASWTILGWLARRYGRSAELVRNPTETWENEGGAVAPDSAATSARRI